MWEKMVRGCPFPLSFPPPRPGPSIFTGLFPDWHEFMGPVRGMLVTGPPPLFALCVCVLRVELPLLNRLVYIPTDVRIINHHVCTQSDFDAEQPSGLSPQSICDPLKASWTLNYFFFFLWRVRLASKYSQNNWWAPLIQSADTLDVPLAWVGRTEKHGNL